MDNQEQQDQQDQADPQPRAPSPPVAPDREDMDRIRLRRLQKLGGPPATSSSSRSSPGPGPSLPKPPPEKSNSETPSKSVSSASSSVSLAQSQPPPTKRPASAANFNTAPAPRPRKVIQETLDEFCDNSLGRIFHVSVDPAKTKDVHGQPLLFLSSSSSELEESSSPLKLNIDNLDQYLFEAGSQWRSDRPLFDYFLPCYKRAAHAVSSLRNPTPEREVLLKEARRLAVSHCIFCLTIPDLYRYEVSPEKPTTWTP